MVYAAVEGFEITDNVTLAVAMYNFDLGTWNYL